MRGCQSLNAFVNACLSVHAHTHTHTQFQHALLHALKLAVTCMRTLDRTHPLTQSMHTHTYTHIPVHTNQRKTELENEIHRLKCERKSLVLRIEEISQHVAQQVCVRAHTLARAHASMAPAAPPGKPRCTFFGWAGLLAHSCRQQFFCLPVARNAFLSTVCLTPDAHSCGQEFLPFLSTACLTPCAREHSPRWI